MSRKREEGKREKLKVLDLFSGIGGFSLGLERTGGFETVAFCEIEPFCRRVLKKHWPDVPCSEDITRREFTAGEAEIICGGFPCQDISYAGEGTGLAGERSGLWRELLRAIRLVRPLYAIVENVAALLNRGMGDVLGDLAEIRYDARWDCIPAVYLGAGHLRDRAWVVAYPAGDGRELPQLHVESPEASPRRQRTGDGPKIGRQWESEPDLVRVVHGLPDRMDRVTALGNSALPQIPEMIGYAILESTESS